MGWWVVGCTPPFVPFSHSLSKSCVILLARGKDMTLIFEVPVIPLHTDQDGVIRVGKTRVRLDTVVYAFNQGYTAEDIVSQYPSLQLADVYAVITYYLNNRLEVDAYIRQRETNAAQVRQEIESRPDYREFRERLLARSQQ